MSKKEFKISIHSLSFRILVLLFSMIVFFLGLVIYNNTAAFRFLLKRIHENSENTLVLYQKNLDENLSRTETYLYSYAFNNADFLSLQSAEAKTTDWYVLLQRIKTNFSNASPLYTVNGFFCYQVSTDTLLLSDKTDNQAPLLFHIIHDIVQAEEDPHPDWFLVDFEGYHYLFRIMNVNGCRLGAYVSTNSLLSTLNNEKSPGSLLYFSDGSLLLRSLDTDVELDSSSLKWGRYPSYQIDDDFWMAISQNLEESSLSLTLLLNFSEYSQYQSEYYMLALFVSLALFGIWLILFTSLHHWVLHPVRTLTGALEQLRNGDLEVRIPGKNQLTEFQAMTDSFNSMVEEIDSLKIENYEKKLSRQKLEALYLKQQITPHFMINCLNTIYQLTENDHSDLARQMIQDLSNHLRYTLSSGQSVSLAEELRLVQNYVDLSSIRYPDALKLVVSCEETLKNATVVPLLLLNFIENTIKYEVSPSLLLFMHIDIWEQEENNCSILHIRIWDTGRGFSDDILQKLLSIDSHIHSEEKHIGIINVVLRLRQLFPDATFSFSNRPDAGAQIDICFPYVPFFWTSNERIL